MIPRTPLLAASQAARLVAGTVRGMFNVGHGAVNTAVRLAAMLFCFGLILQALSNAADPYRCGALVRHGSWPPYTPPKINPAADYEQLETLQRQGRDPPPARPFDKWEPAGCRMHEYSREDIRACLGGKRVLFVGDSTVRVLFFAALTRLEHEAAEWLLRTTFIERNPRHDLAIDSETVQLQFIWDPWLNSTTFLEEMNHFEPGNSKDADPADKPDLVIIGSAGLWAARNEADNLYFDTFCASTARVARVMGDAVQPFGKQKTDNYVFLAPVQIPRYELLLPGRAESLSPERIARMNNYLGSLPPAVQSHIMTAYNDMTYHVPEAYEDTGLHVADTVAERWIDIPLNARCNGMLLERPASEQPVPSMSHSTTCCVAYPGPVRGQKSLLYGIYASMVVPAVIFLLRNRPAALSSYIFYAFIGPALLYCYMADRSQLFAKSEKHYEPGWLRFSFIVSGICFIASQKRHLRPRDEHQTVSPHRKSLLEVEFLPRHISDEWKGIMQAAILLLAYQDSSQIPFVSRWTEFVTTSFLFLSAFGHTSYFLQFGDFSLRRVALVLLRLNLLPSLVVLMLDGHDTGTPHSLTHLVTFPRLISFWFLIVYITLRVGSHSNRSHPHTLLLKIAVAATVLIYMVLRPGTFGFFETLDRIGQRIFGGPTTWDVEKMRLAVHTDWCAPFVGMVLAVLAQRAAIVCDRMRRQQQQKQNLLSGQKPATPGRPRTSTGPSTNGDAVRPFGARARASTLSNTTGVFSHFTTPEDINIRNSVSKNACFLDQLIIAILYPDELLAPVQAMIVIFSSVFFLGFASATTASPVMDGKKPHPYLTTVAVICFAVVRNAHSQLRVTYMALPAALGAMALELSVLRNHILLSGNGTGHLRLLSIYPPAIEDDGGSFGEHLMAARVAAVHCLEIASIATIFLVVSWCAYQSTRMLSTVIFGGGHTEDNALDLRGLAKEAAKDTDAGLPRHNGDNASSMAMGSVGPSTSSALLRAGGILLFFWSLNRYYL